ncbi:putative adhesin [Streptomyces sp. NPDC051014]|uniref:putative adhesin n=1 Tax=Streptomyces sp. NPDC051014 TaxID=3155751 RepID=UPI0033F6B639
MGYVLLGHGGLYTDDRTPAGMEIVAIPAGTTLQFYTDAGQDLGYDEAGLELWPRLQAPWPPLSAGNVTYNYCLYRPNVLPPDAQNGQFGGHQLIMPGTHMPDEVWLCEGTVESCPTDPRQVEEGAVHRCTGLLGMYQGDLHWLACSGFVGADAVVRNAVTAGVAPAVVLGRDPDWTPTAADLKTLARRNRSNVKQVADQDGLAFVIGGSALLIGAGHASHFVMYANSMQDLSRGWVSVRKGRGRNPGSLTFDGVPVAKQTLVEHAVAQFSDKHVVFEMGRRP